MGLIKEPKNVDFSTKSEQWTEEELLEFRKIMQQIKKKNGKRTERMSVAAGKNVKNVRMQQGT